MAKHIHIHVGKKKTKDRKSWAYIDNARKEIVQLANSLDKYIGDEEYTMSRAVLNKIERIAKEAAS